MPVDPIGYDVSTHAPTATVQAWRVATAALIIFAAGVLTGGVSAELISLRLRASRPKAAPTPRSTNGTPSGVPDRILPSVRLPGAARLELAERLATDLDLTPDQKTEFLKALAESQGRLAKLWNPVIPSAKSEVEQFNRRLAEILTPDQMAKLERLSQRRPVVAAPR